ncbi:MAG: hypothetical protein UY70_C0014G0005 [Candidatus Kaiserbacteria bacterium GW2011_GWB1_52_6]|uniref:Uncharacterized protein n=2 Tax=Candidatus Kaiseribacteriota TaxID=1752734 RepID=A0A0G1X9B5_9BACT|nr:MAG: hypothetical protein UY67_C0011G0025 [Candidatus Kaiserbacteria bacterium GW2011_GWA2_52_12]KKW27440.1 MAG: hypothetical protein UY70_C0014G0005 [Candidatus Kaiserbacteria bacterium GW2011_GWB1_52_6]
MPVFRPPEWIPKNFDERPYVFLAGPIEGAPDWQRTADWNVMRQSEFARHIVVAADRGFPGRKYISLMLKKYDIPLNDTLAEACRSALLRFR